MCHTSPTCSGLSVTSCGKISTPKCRELHVIGRETLADVQVVTTMRKFTYISEYLRRVQGSLPESSDNSLQPVPEWLPRGETLPQQENRFVIMSTFIMACQHCHYLCNSDPSEAEAQHLFLMKDSSVHLSQNFSFKAKFILFLVGICTNGTKTQLFACRGKLKIQRIRQ